MKKILLVVTLVFFLFVIQNLIHSIFSLWQKRELLINAREEVFISKRENQSLKEQMAAVGRPSFIEQQARDKLYLTKPGEQIVIIPDDLIVKNTLGDKVTKEHKANWELWWELFF